MVNCYLSGAPVMSLSARQAGRLDPDRKSANETWISMRKMRKIMTHLLSCQWANNVRIKGKESNVVEESLRDRENDKIIKGRRKKRKRVFYGQADR